jgi:hypothetical protein
LVQDPEIRRFLERPDAKQELERAAKVGAMSPERMEAFFLRHRALDYLRDPVGFLESVRNRAAVEVAERRRVPLIEARATVDAHEAAALKNQSKST